MDEFRKCTFTAVTKECGNNAANVSDYLFHTHGSYFTKYTLCSLSGEQFTKCWYDWLSERLAASTTTTTTTARSVVASTTTQQSVSPTESTAQESKSVHAWSHSPDQQHTTYVSVTSSEHSTVESTESNNVVSTEVSSKESVHKKESSMDNDE